MSAPSLRGQLASEAVNQGAVWSGADVAKCNPARPASLATTAELWDELRDRTKQQDDNRVATIDYLRCELKRLDAENKCLRDTHATQAEVIAELTDMLAAVRKAVGRERL